MPVGRHGLSLKFSNPKEREEGLPSSNQNQTATVFVLVVAYLLIEPLLDRVRRQPD
jgi:hypothetical protein